ncbi:AAA family ATPase [Alkalihalobacterium sp. APHAB7]|uniref:AAA family ATPase n=1 Tax=Alkalihalobacterium sp. APHAB7 TaxID=3402081 RepID=UPI003AAFC23F
MLLQKIMDKRKKLLLEKKVPTQEELQEDYRLFQEKFGPEKLKGLQGEELLETLSNLGNRDSLVYWLEFKNDDQFRTTVYGSISGGSAFKYIMFKRSSDGVWVTGYNQDPVELNQEQAIDMAIKIRDNLVKGAEMIGQLVSKEGPVDEDAYIKIQLELEAQLEFNMGKLGWVHKYYHMIFPERIDDFHNADWQKNALIKIHVKPNEQGGLYSWAGQIMAIARQCECPVNHFTHCLNELYGGPHHYIRVGTTSGTTSYWNEMYIEGHIAIGWPALGDLSRFEDMKITEMKKHIRAILEENYDQTPQVIGKWTLQIVTFFTRLHRGTVIVAAEGQTVLGIGKVIGGYQYVEGKDFPHTVKVDWLKTPNTKLPNPSEGLQTTTYQLRDIDNLLAIEKILAEEQHEPIPVPTKLEPLTGMATKIEKILSRKRQVILYGPPGTGKTHHAEHTCSELSAREIYNKNFATLTEEQKAVIKGNRTARGTVRMCTFHPSYGYEDFMEGIKPTVINDQTVFKLKDGIFKTICQDASNHPDHSFYLIIDEINRGDISRIFGELITIIESNKRGKEVILPLSNEPFQVPKNVYIIGTMNTADRSIALLDVALRRRFGFIELLTDYSLLEDVLIESLPLGEWLKALNARIVENLGQDARNLQIGHAYFLEKEKPIRNYEKFKRIIEEDIIPLIEEYCYGDYATMAKILGSAIVDVKQKTIKADIFTDDSTVSLVNALLEPTPELSTENHLVPETEDEGLDEEEQEENVESKLVD